MRCIITTPHNQDLCNDQCATHGQVRFFYYKNHEYMVVTPLCRVPMIGYNASAMLALAVKAMEREIDCRIITKDEAREICQEFDDDIDIKKTQFSEYCNRSSLYHNGIKPIYSSGLPSYPYELFARRDVMLWIHNKLTIRSVEKWADNTKLVHHAECEVCNRYIPSHILEVLQARITINPCKKTWATCPRCKKEVLPQEKEDQAHLDLINANMILERLTTTDREILECHDQERRERKAIKQARKQFNEMKLHVRDSNLEALRSLAEELKQPPTSPI